MPDGGYPLPAVTEPEESIYVCVRIPDDIGHRQAFAGALYTLTRWWNWQRDESNTAKDAGAVWFPIFVDVMNQMNRRLSSCGGDESAADTGPECPVCGSGGGGYVSGAEDDSEEDEMHIIYMPDGKAYLTDNTCGCPTKFFALNGVELVVDGDGVSIPKVGPKDVPVEFAPVGDDYQACYAGKAVPYLLARATEFHATLTEIYVTGVDFLAGGIDEWLDIGAIIVDLLGGESDSVLDTLRGYSEEDVEDAFTDPDFVEIMEDLFVEDGPVDRVALMTWAKAAPVTWDNVGTMAILRNWVSMSFVQGYGEQLREFAAECVTGNDADDLIGGGDLQEDGSYYHEVDVSGIVYPVWVYNEAHVVNASGYEHNFASGRSPIGFFIEGVVAAGTGTIDVCAVLNGVGAKRKTLMAAETTYSWGICATAGAITAAEEVMGTDLGSCGNDSAEPAPTECQMKLKYWTAATPREFTSSKYVVVGAAL